MRLFRRFKSDESGATAIMFGLSLIPVIGLVGGAVDYSRAARAHSELQKAVDAATIVLTRAPASASQADLESQAKALVGANFHPDASVQLDPIRVSRTGRAIQVAASGSVQTAIMAVMGMDRMNISTEAHGTSGGKNIELALVLDNTGSMNEVVKGRRKIDELKSASLDLLSILQKSTTSADQIKVSIVPFDTQVRVDAATHRNADWLRIDSRDRSGWQGYVMDRDWDSSRGINYDVSDAVVDKIYPATLYPSVLGLRGSDELATIRPLTSVSSGYQMLKDTVGVMRPGGCTNITIGAAWGMAALSKGEPLSEAAAPSNGLEKILMIVTDGDNTKNRFDGDCREGTSASKKIDSRTELACANAKAAGIRVITVRLIEGNATLLRNCASVVTDRQDPFYRNGEPLYNDVQNPADLKVAFQTIANAIVGTRLTH